VETGRRLPDIPVHRAQALAVAKSALMVASNDDTQGCRKNSEGCDRLDVYDPASGKRFGHTAFTRIRDAALSRDGRYAAFTNGGRQLHLWRVSDPSPKKTDIEIEPYSPRFLLSPDAAWLAACSPGSGFAVLRTDSPAEIRSVNTGVPCQTVAFDSSGKLLAVVGDSGISVWTTADLHKVRDLSISASEKDVSTLSYWSAAAFNSDGSLLATLGRSNLLRVWRWREGEEVSRMRLFVEKPAFAAGDRLFVGSFLAWKPADVIAEACRRLTSELTPDEIAHFLPWERSYRPVCTVRPEVRQIAPRKQ
jgi:WD40 repeat protein